MMSHSAARRRAEMALLLVALLPVSSLGASCPAARNHTDQRGGQVLCGRSPTFITTQSDEACCGVCFEDASPGRACQKSSRANAWVREPSTGHCWCIEGATAARHRRNRVAGFRRDLLPSSSAATPPPIGKIERNENNVGGAMPNPSGNPTHGVLLVGTMSTAAECAAAATKNAKATSWTYHQCNFLPVKSGNYSCHCYVRTDGHWAPRHQDLIDSGNIKATPAPPPPAPIFECVSNSDCQLNGKCGGTAAGVCECDPAWTGERCQLLNLLPAAADAGLQDPLLSSWGGSVLQDHAASGTWHMYAAVIENSCGLSAWRPNSAIGHATSTSGPTGPFKLELPLIKPHFAHEPVALRTSDGTIAIWHIGAGMNDTGPGSNYAANCSGLCTGKGHHWQPGTTFYGPTSILHSESYNGPWTSLDIGNCSNLPGCAQCGDTNPAPVLHPNGESLALAVTNQPANRYIMSARK